MEFHKNIDCLCDPYDYDKSVIYGIQYSVVTDLATEPVDLAFFKQHSRIDYNIDDNLCEQYIIAARKYLEQWTQLSFGVKTMRLRALFLPKNYRMMFGLVDTITTPDYTNVGDIFKEGGTNLDLEYTTIGVMDETIKIAICRYAAGLYAIRENFTEGKMSQDLAKEMLNEYRNVTLF